MTESKELLEKASSTPKLGVATKFKLVKVAKPWETVAEALLIASRSELRSTASELTVLTLTVPWKLVARFPNLSWTSITGWTARLLPVIPSWQTLATTSPAQGAVRIANLCAAA